MCVCNSKWCVRVFISWTGSARAPMCVCVCVSYAKWCSYGCFRLFSSSIVIIILCQQYTEILNYMPADDDDGRRESKPSGKTSTIPPGLTHGRSRPCHNMT